MLTIFVTNNSDLTLIDGWNGVEYTFKPNSTVEVPELVAKHVFGYGDKDKEPYLARLGWIKSKNDIEEGIKKLSEWEFSTEAPKKDRSLSPMVEKVPLPVARRAGGKILSAVK